MPPAPVSRIFMAQDFSTVLTDNRCHLSVGRYKVGGSWLPENLPQPRLIARVPGDRFFDAGFEGVSRLPSQFSLNLRGVDGITAIVPRAILDVLDELVAFAQRGQHETSDFHVGLFVVAADVVDLSRYTAVKHDIDRPAVIFHMQPVANVETIAVDGHLL